MKRVVLLSSAAITAAGMLLAPGLTANAAATTKVTNACISSVPDAGSSTPQKICYSLFQPPKTDAKQRVPLIFRSHGWGGSRATEATDFTAFLNAGYGVL